MSDRPDAESPTIASDGAHDDAGDGDETPRVSSLWQTPSPFSMRRLLNWASIVVVGILLLALAVHWPPGILPGHTHTQAPRSAPSGNSALPPSPGTNWKLVGPDWATAIAFTANGALGYVCGGQPPEPIIFFGFYDVHQQTWTQFPTPATVGGGCRVSVSPADPGDVVLIVFPTSYSSSQVYRSHDGGAFWLPISLPTARMITDIAWTNNGTVLLVAEDMTAGPTKPPTFSLLASRDNGPLTEITARQLIGRTTPLGRITIQSSGTMLYASVDGVSCASYCTTLARSGDDGQHWFQLPATYQGQPLIVAAAQANTDSLVGWSFDPRAGAMLVLRSDNGGAAWRTLPGLPTNPATSGAAIFQAPDGDVYAFCFQPANTVYALRHGATTWRAVAPLPDGAPVAGQYDASGHAVALWAQSHGRTSGAFTPGLEYYPLARDSA